MSGSRRKELRHRIRRRAQQRALRQHPCCPIETHSAISTAPVGPMPQPAKPSKVSLLRGRAQHAASVDLPRPRRMVSDLVDAKSGCQRLGDLVADVVVEEAQVGQHPAVFQNKARIHKASTFCLPPQSSASFVDRPERNVESSIAELFVGLQ